MRDISIYRSSFVLLCIVIVVAIAIVFRFDAVPLAITGDGQSYLDAAHWFAGDEVPSEDIHPARFLKPLPPLILSVLVRLGLDDLTAFLVMNCFSYLGFLCASWVLMKRFFLATEPALWGTLMIATAYPVLYYGLDLYVDLGAWALFVATIAALVGYVRSPSTSSAVVIGCLLALGIAWKEYAVLLGVAAAITLLWVPYRSATQRIGDFFLFSVPSLAVLGAAQYFVWAQFSFTYLDWFRIGTTVPADQMEFTAPFVLKSLFATMLLAWPLALAGMIGVKRLTELDKKFLFSLAVPLLLIFLWSYVSARLYFVVAPFAALLAVHGLMTYCKATYVRVAVMVLVVAVNIGWVVMVTELRPLVHSLLV